MLAIPIRFLKYVFPLEVGGCFPQRLDFVKVIWLTFNKSMARAAGKVFDPT